MVEQQGEEVGGDDVDFWVEVLVEQEVVGDDVLVDVGDVVCNVDDWVFKLFDVGVGSGVVCDLEMIMDILVKFSVELGCICIIIKQLLELVQGLVVELDGLVGEFMDIFINGYLIVQGEVVVVEDKYGICIIEIIIFFEWVQKFN